MKAWMARQTRSFWVVLVIAVFQGWLLGVIAVLYFTGGAVLPIDVYDSNPNERMVRLLEESEELRQIEDEWKQFWEQGAPEQLPPPMVEWDDPAEK